MLNGWMSPSPPFDPAKLPDDPKVLREALVQALELLKEKNQRIETMGAWIQELRVRLFGRKSETLSQENQRLLSFLVEGVAARKPEPLPEPPPPPPAPERKGHGRAKIPDNLLRDIIVYDVPKKERRCQGCRKELVPIGQVTTEQVEYEPSSVHVKKRIRMKYACPDCECRGSVVLADLPPQAVPKSKAAEGMLAFVATAKLGLHLPLYRLEEFLANHGFPVYRSTLWEWEKGVAEAMEPVVKVMKGEIQGSPVIETDETPVPLRDQERGGMKQGRQWTYLNDEHTVYEFSPDRKREHPAAFLANSKGTILSDAYTGYRSIARESAGRLINAFCMAHLRRMFWKALGTDPQRALVGMAYIRALYVVEHEGDGLSPAKLRKLRQRESKPIFEKFKGWLDEQGPAVLPKSPIGKAIAYALKNWTELGRFLEDGRIRIDNNRSENQLRPIAVGRKAWLRHETEKGGRVAAILSSLVASCRRHGKNPFEYFRDVLRRLPTHPARKILDLTPARWKPKPNTS
jgi:transposase